MSQCLQFFIKDNQFDIISLIKSSFVEKNKNFGPIIGYTYSTNRSFIDKKGGEWFRFISDWDYEKEPDAVKYRYRLHVDVKRTWRKYFSTASGIDFVFSSKKNAKRSLKRIKKGIDIFNQTGEL